MSDEERQAVDALLSHLRDFKVLQMMDYNKVGGNDAPGYLLEKAMDRVRWLLHPQLTPPPPILPTKGNPMATGELHDYPGDVYLDGLETPENRVRVSISECQTASADRLLNLVVAAGRWRVLGVRPDARGRGDAGPLAGGDGEGRDEAGHEGEGSRRCTMKPFYMLLLKGRGDGCDYTIGCNMTWRRLKAETAEAAHAEALEALRDYGLAEMRIGTATVLCVAGETVIDVEAWVRAEGEKARCSCRSTGTKSASRSIR